MTNKIALICLVFFSFCSCSKMNLFEKEGEYHEIRFELENITQIKNLNTYNIDIIQGKKEEEYLLLKGGENVLKKASVTFSKQEVILNHEYANWTRNYELITAEIHLNKLNSLIIDAPAKVNSTDTLSGDKLSINITANAELVEMNLNLNYSLLNFDSHGSVSGGYEFAGICTESDYTLNGITNLKSPNLKSTNVKLVQNGIGEAHVWAEEKLKLTVYNIGNIYYKGNPEIEINRIHVNNQSPTAMVIPEK